MHWRERSVYYIVRSGKLPSGGYAHSKSEPFDTFQEAKAKLEKLPGTGYQLQHRDEYFDGYYGEWATDHDRGGICTLIRR